MFGNTTQVIQNPSVVVEFMGETFGATDVWLNQVLPFLANMKGYSDVALFCNDYSEQTISIFAEWGAKLIQATVKDFHFSMIYGTPLPVRKTKDLIT